MIDTDRMTHGKAVASRLRGGTSGGIPWSVILDGEGTARVNSDGPKGNIGCPAQPHEIDYFLQMIDRTRRHMSDLDRGILARELRAYGATLSRRAPLAGAREYGAAGRAVKFGAFADATRQLAAAFAAGYPPQRLLVDAAMRPLREDPDQRPKLAALLAEYVTASQVCLVDGHEPGRRIRLRGRALDQVTGRPVVGALVKLFHTDAAGEYRPGMDAGGGAGNPRLWGYLRTDPDGRFVVDTIMPERYTKSSVPRHVHYTVTVDGAADFVSECFFDADPLLDDKTRKAAPGRNFPIVELQRDDQLYHSGTLTIRMPRRGG